MNVKDGNSDFARSVTSQVSDLQISRWSYPLQCPLTVNSVETSINSTPP